jgi:F0F1-type ATP synthase assembly protein I
VQGSFRLIPAEEHRDDRKMWQGFSDALAHAVELVGTTVIFILLGLWLDNSIGTRPLFTVALGLLAAIGLGARAYYQYVADTAREEKGKPWTRNPNK